VAPPLEIADRYLERARTDRSNAETWVYCAAAALKRGSASDAAAEAYARDIAATLQSTMRDPAESPCDDAIPASIWGGARSPVTSGSVAGEPLTAPNPDALTPEEEERLRRLNAEADAKERGFAEAKAAALQRQRESQARYDRERAEYEADVAAAKAAEEDYQRRLAEHRRLLESGQYQSPR